MEPLFRAGPARQAYPELAALVPQVTIDVGGAAAVSILDVGHRLGDAMVRTSSLGTDAKAAFEALLKTHDAEPMARLAPTSLVFGVWDSRDTSAKVPRIVQATIRAWNVDVLHRSAQYGPPVDYSALDVFSEEEKAKDEGNPKSPLAQRGFVHVPAPKMLGGVIAHGPIVRDVTINLIALRRLESKGDGAKLRSYLLGLALVAGTEPMDGFLRQGCLVTPRPDAPANWNSVGRDGTRAVVALTPERARSYAARVAKAFGVAEPRQEKFDKDLAKADLTENKAAKKKASPKSKAKA